MNKISTYLAIACITLTSGAAETTEIRRRFDPYFSMEKEIEWAKSIFPDQKCIDSNDLLCLADFLEMITIDRFKRVAEDIKLPSGSPMPENSPEFQSYSSVYRDLLGWELGQGNLIRAQKKIENYRNLTHAENFKIGNFFQERYVEQALAQLTLHLMIQDKRMLNDSIIQLVETLELDKIAYHALTREALKQNRAQLAQGIFQASMKDIENPTYCMMELDENLLQNSADYQAIFSRQREVDTDVTALQSLLNSNNLTDAEKLVDTIDWSLVNWPFAYNKEYYLEAIRRQQGRYKEAALYNDMNWKSFQVRGYRSRKNTDGTSLTIEELKVFEQIYSHRNWYLRNGMKDKADLLSKKYELDPNHQKPRGISISIANNPTLKAKEDHIWAKFKDTPNDNNFAALMKHNEYMAQHVVYYSKIITHEIFILYAKAKGPIKALEAFQKPSLMRYIQNFFHIINKNIFKEDVPDHVLKYLQDKPTAFGLNYADNIPNTIPLETFFKIKSLAKPTTMRSKSDYIEKEFNIHIFNDDIEAAENTYQRGYVEYQRYKQESMEPVFYKWPTTSVTFLKSTLPALIKIGHLTTAIKLAQKSGYIHGSIRTILNTNNKTLGEQRYSSRQIRDFDCRGPYY